MNLINNDPMLTGMIMAVEAFDCKVKIHPNKVVEIIVNKGSTFKISEQQRAKEAFEKTFICEVKITIL